MQMEQTIQQYTYRQLFSYLNKADIINARLADKVIAFVGLTRSGKSATLNSIISPASLIGRKKGINTFYEPLNTNDPNFAEIGHSFSSVTIMANVRKYVQNGMEINLVDLGGLGQKRQGMLVLVVNYMLAFFLKSATKVKFILVMTYKDFVNISSNNFRDTFLQFLDLFNFKQMQEKQIQGLFNSVSLYITSYDKDQVDNLFDNLLEMKKNLEELYLKNHQYMPNYYVCERLINHLVKNKRVEYFLLAKKDKSPLKNQVIESLNKKNWNYFQIQKIKNLIKYPYAKQFQNFLTESQQNFLISIINERFGELKSYNKILRNILMKIKQNLCEKALDLSQEIKELNILFIENTFYEDMKNLQVKLETKGLSVGQKIRNLTSIIRLTQGFQLFGDWRNKNPYSQSSEYLEVYCKQYFLNVIHLVVEIIGYSPENYTTFKKLSLILQKLFKEAAVLQQLQTKTNESNSLQSDLKLYIKDNIIIDDFVKEKELKLNLITELRTKQFRNHSFTNVEIVELFQFTKEIEEKYYEINPIYFYQIKAKLSIMQAEQLYNNYTQIANNSKQLAMSNYLNALKETLFIVCCLVDASQFSEIQQYNKAVALQKIIIKGLIKVLFQLQHVAKCLEICGELKLHQNKTEVYMNLLKIQKEPYQRLYEVARHFKSIGDITNSEYYFKVLINKQKNMARPGGFKDPKIQIEDLRKNYMQYHTIKAKCSHEENQPINGKRALQIINEIRKTILKMPEQFHDLQLIKNAYDRKLKKILNNNELDKQYPNNPTNQELITLSRQKIELVSNKKINLLIGCKNQCGLTTFGYALTNQRFKIIHQKKYQLQNQRFKGKINHEQVSEKGQPINNEFPAIINLTEDECIVDMPRFFDFTPEKVAIKAHILQSFITKSSHFRMILVCKQQDVLYGDAKQLIKMLVFIMKSLKMVDKSDSQYKLGQYNAKITQSLALGITFVTNTPDNIKAIKALISNLKNKDKTIENEKNYNVVQFEQQLLSNLLQTLFKKGRIIHFFKPNIQKKLSFKFMEELCKQKSKTGFNYIETKDYLQNHQIQIGYKIICSFNHSEHSKFISRLQTLLSCSINCIQEVIRIVSQSMSTFMQNNYEKSLKKKKDRSEFEQLQKIADESNTKLRVFRQQTKYIPQGQVLIEYQDENSELAKRLKIVQKLLQLTNVNFSEQFDKMIPYEYGDLFKSFKTLIADNYINNVSELICHNERDVQALYKTKLALQKMFTQLQVYGELIKTMQYNHMAESKPLHMIGQTMVEYIRIKDCSDHFVQSSAEEIFQFLFKSFEFTDLCYQISEPYIQEKCYQYYKSILLCWKEKNDQYQSRNEKYTFKIEGVEVNKQKLNIYYDQLMKAMQEHYKKHNRLVDQIVLLIELCMWNLERQEDDDDRQISKASSFVAHINLENPIQRMLIEIAKLLTKVLPAKSQEFAKVINKPVISDQIYEKMEKYEQNNNQKIIILQKHISFLAQWNMQSRINEIYQKLRVIAPTTHPKFIEINQFLNNRKQIKIKTIPNTNKTPSEKIKFLLLNTKNLLIKL